MTCRVLKSTERLIRVIGFALFVGLLAVGCGPSTGDLTGKVTYKDKPLAGAAVSVKDSRGGVRVGEVGQDGTYTVSAIPTGPAKIIVTYVDPQVDEYAKMLAGKARGAKDGIPKSQPTLDESKLLQIPTHYSDFEQSGFKLTIEGRPDNKLDLLLK